MSTIFYARVSTADQTISHQRKQAEAAGFQIDEVVADDGVSGISTRLCDRPEGRRLFDMIRRGDVLVVRWVDRLGRNYADVTDTIREFMRRGVVIRTVINGLTFDGATNDPMQAAVRDALIAFMAATAQAQGEAQGGTEGRDRPCARDGAGILSGSQARVHPRAVRNGARHARNRRYRRRRGKGYRAFPPVRLPPSKRSGAGRAHPCHMGRCGRLTAAPPWVASSGEAAGRGITARTVTGDGIGRRGRRDPDRGPAVVCCWVQCGAAGRVDELRQAKPRSREALRHQGQGRGWRGYRRS